MWNYFLPAFIISGVGSLISFLGLTATVQTLFTKFGLPGGIVVPIVNFILVFLGIIINDLVQSKKMVQ